MRKTGLILLAFLLVFTSIPFTTPFTPAVEAAGDDGKRETFNITLPNAYGQKPSGYKFQKINHSGKMNYSIVVERVKARTQITRDGTQIMILLRSDGTGTGLLNQNPNPFNTNLNNTRNPIPNVPQATEFLGEMFNRWKNYVGTANFDENKGYVAYNDLASVIGQVKSPKPFYFQGVTWEGIDARWGAFRVQQASVFLESYSVHTTEDVQTEFEVDLRFSVSIQFDEMAIADSQLAFFYNYHSNVILDRFAFTADRTKMDSTPRANADVSGSLSIIEDQDNLRFHLFGGLNRAVPNANYNDPTWTVERRNPGGMPSFPIPTYMFYVYINYDPETETLSIGRNSPEDGIVVTKNKFSLGENFNKSENLAMPVDYDRGEYMVAVPILNALRFYEDAANPLKQTKVGNLNWNEVSQRLTREFEILLGRAIERIIRDIDQTYETNFAQQIKNAPAMNFFGNSTDIDAVKNMGVNGNFYYTDKATYEQNLQNLMKGGIVLGGPAAAGGVSEQLWNDAISRGAKLIRIGGKNRAETQNLVAYYLYDPDANSASNQLARQARELIFQKLAQDYNNKEFMESWHIYTYSENRVRNLMGDRLLPRSYEARKEILDIAREGWQARDPKTQSHYDQRLKKAYEKHLTIDDIVDAYFSFAEGARFRNMIAMPFKIKQPERLVIEIVDTGINPKIDGLEQADHTMDEYENLKNREPGQSSYAIPGKTYRAKIKVTNYGDFPITNNVVRYYVVSSQPGSGNKPKIYSSDILGMFFGTKYEFDDGVKKITVEERSAKIDEQTLGKKPNLFKGTEVEGFLNPRESYEIEFDWKMPTDQENPNRDPVYLYVTIGEKINENKSMVNQGTAQAPDWAPFFERDLLKYAPGYEPATLIAFTPTQIFSRDEDNTKAKDRHVIAIRFDTVANPDEDPYATPPDQLMSEQPFLRFETITTVTESEVPKWIQDGYWADLERATLKYRRTQWLVE